MNNLEAKFILNAYRPGGRDAGDATFEPALAQARSDPALGAWFAREQTHGGAVAAKLREIAPPAGLRDAILTGARLGGSATAGRRAWWAQPSWLVAAAAAVLLAMGTALWPRWQAAGDGDLTTFAVEDAKLHVLHGGHGLAAAAWQTTLSQSSARVTGLPALDFSALRNTGCRTLSVAGHDVLEVCFQRDGKWFHCYIGRRADFSALANLASPLLVQRGAMGVATWADAAHVFVLASDAGLAAVQRLL
ncbi:MAG: hypothetical protein EXS32_15285 [Opitutus sp.]|nr:hypothetical protein [Opitutus sp.]